MFSSLTRNILYLVCFNLLSFVFIKPSPLYGRTILSVSDQLSFDKLQDNLISAIRSGDKEINVILSRGAYVAKEKHLTLKDIKAPDVAIRIIGNDAIILPDGQNYKNGDKYKGIPNVDNSWMSNSSDIDTWSGIRYAEGLIEVVDEVRKLCKLKSAVPLMSLAKGASHILIPHWYQSSIYEIDNISGNNIYFRATDLKVSSYGGYNINDDYNYGKKKIRFKLFNTSGEKDNVRIVDGKVLLPNGINSARESHVNRFITINNCSFNSIEFSGIKFWGNSYAKNSSAIFFNKVKCNKILLRDCEFRGMRSNVLTITASHNVIVENNIFFDCYYYGIISSNNSKNTIVKNNTFNGMNKRMQNTFCIVCRGTNYLITRNRLIDFGYGGICIGVHYKNPDNNPCTGIAEYNELFFTDKYIANISNYGIMDSGAIYLTTKHNGTIIRNNYIHDYLGIKDNRGVFCDDGAYNIQICNNIISAITNSYCIDSRRVISVEKSKSPLYDIERTNINIVIRDNIVDGRIRFEANGGNNNGCVKGANYILMKKEGKVPKNTIKNIVSPEEDIPLDCVGTANGKFHITSQSYKKLKKSKGWKYYRNHVRKY